MERIGILLDKIRELNNKGGQDLIEIDLMMDYTRVLYADLVEWRSKLSFNNPVALKNDPGNVADESKINTPDVAAPPVELDSTVLNYESASTASSIDIPVQTISGYSTADIRQQIGINDKYQFISELFGNNKDAYEEVINEINTFDSYDEAMAWLNSSVGNQFDWKEDTESVQSFYKLLSDFFANR